VEDRISGHEDRGDIMHIYISRILRNTCPSRYRGHLGTQRDTVKRTLPQHIIVKTLSTENTERILKSARNKHEVTYNSKPIRINSDFSTEIFKARRAWNEVF
jgi:hypothetical protein